jgi:hypothetical protein
VVDIGLAMKNKFVQVFLGSLDMNEVAYHKRKDGCSVVLSREKGKFTVAVYNRSDIEEWSEEYDNEDKAWRRYKAAREESLV